MNFYQFSGLLISISSGLITVAMFFFGHKKLHYLFGGLCLSILTFGIGMYFVGGTTIPETASFWWKVGHIGAILIPVLFFHFVNEFLEIKKVRALILLYIVSILLLIADFTDGLFINNMRFVFGQFYYDSPPGLFYPLYTIMFICLTAYSHILLWNSYKKIKDRLKKQQIKFFFLATIVGFLGGAFNFLPVYGIDIYPVMTITIFLYPLILSYAIVKHDLFNMKVIATELLVLILSVVLLIRAVLSVSLTDKFINYGILVAVALAGFFLIKSVQKEVDAKEENEKLAEGLEQANEQLKAIDERKSDFINIASHQLRTPTTAIKGYTALLLEGDYGEVPPKEREIIERMEGLADQNVKIIADMLNISRIEQNRMKYTFEKVEIAKFILDIIHTLKIKAEGKKLPLDYTFDKTLNDSLTTDAKVYAQVDKTLLAQVFENVIDNSVKYTNKGGVNIDIKLEGKKLTFKCKDTGIGIDKESIATLFKKFGRSKNAQASGIEGTGIGLYIAKEIMEKHHGDITITSEGENKGSESVVTLEVE